MVIPAALRKSVPRMHGTESFSTMKKFTCTVEPSGRKTGSVFLSISCVAPEKASVIDVGEGKWGAGWRGNDRIAETADCGSAEMLAPQSRRQRNFVSWILNVK